MIVTYSQEKLGNAIVYFVSNTKYCHTLKLFKLLCFLDFEHYRQSGMPVTNLTYKALPNGPVPTELYAYFNDPVNSIHHYIDITEIRDDFDDKLILHEIKPKQTFDKQYFSDRELEIMDRLVFFFDEIQANDMSEFSHDPKLPWRKVYKRGEGENEIIPIELALDSPPIVKDEETISKDEMNFLKEA